MFERNVGLTPDDDVTRPVSLAGTAAPAGLTGDEAGYVSQGGRHRTAPSRTGVRTVAAAALFSVPTGGLAVAVMAPQAPEETQSLRTGLAANTTDMTAATMSLGTVQAPTSFAPVAAAPTSGSDIVDAQQIESQKLPVVEKQVADPTMDEGTRTVVDPGREGARSVIWRVTYDKGREIGREKIATGQNTPASPRIVKFGTKKKQIEQVNQADQSDQADSSDSKAEKKQARSASAPAVSNGATWDKLAKCESGGDWSTDTGNGYQGGLQFDKKTWQAYGGGQYAPTADQASREQQIAVAEKVKDDRGGYSAWPSCSSKLGLS